MKAHDPPPAASQARQPDLSVVIPSVNGWTDLQGCLRALSAQAGGYDIEVIVADRIGEAVRAPLRREFSHVRVLHAGCDVTIPQLRALAFAEARAEIVAVIEDHVLVRADWAAKMIAAHRAGAVIVGGAVDNAATDRLVDWAAFLTEYSHCLAPAAGSATWLAGNNVAYGRTLLKRFNEVIERGRWEDHLHDAVRSAGVTLVSRPDIVVGHKKHYTIGEYLSQRYLYARSYAGLKSEQAGRRRKVLRGLASLALPPFLVYRIVWPVLKARRYRRELVLSLPLLALFVASWAIGEAVGHLFGAGNALARVR